VLLWDQHNVAWIDVLQRKKREVIAVLVHRPRRRTASDDLAEHAGVRIGNGATVRC
jgi:hypothetical protein